MRVRWDFVVLCVMVILITGTTTMAQDFQQLLNAVDRVEANLKALIEKESSARTADIAKLRKEMLAQTGSGAASDINPIIAQIQKDLDSLRLEVGRLAGPGQQIASAEDMGAANATPTANQIASLTDGLTTLNTRLESYMNSEQLIPSANAGTTEAVAMATVPNFNLYGFVNATAIRDRNSDRSSFALEETELDVEHGFSDKASVRADIEFVNDGSGTFDMDLEQGYLSYNLGSVQKWTFGFGKFNAPIGFEAIDAPDRYQHSYAAISTYALPGNLTGASLRTQFSPQVSAVMYICNGWDVNSDNNAAKTIGMNWGLSPTADLGFSLSAITGPEQDDRTDSRRSVFDMVTTFQVTPSLLLVGEANYGMESRVLNNGDDAKWFGFLLMSNMKMGGNVNLTMRADYLRDDNGYHTGFSQDLKAFTVAPRVQLIDGLEGLLEMKYEFSNQDVFYASTSSQKAVKRFGPRPAPIESEGLKNNRLSLVAEMTYRF